ncbi:MAG: hypothetical protein GF364_02750 [Candidatus Lokiarchaeota archaeon]|nr:hypothetical protein [Candidatus Lokiarchaeota archaeon]
MKLIVIGGNPAGLSCASGVRRAHKNWDIIVYEMGSYISYGSCGLPYYVCGIVEHRDNLMTLTPEVLSKKRNVPLKLHHKVTSVDFDNKKVTVLNLDDNTQFVDTYDYLMIATGATPKIDKRWNIKLDHPRVFQMHIIPDADKIINAIKNQKLTSGVLIGAGYIGLEMLEAYIENGINDLTLIGPRLVFRSESEKYVQDELEKHNIKIIKGIYVRQVEAISDDRIKCILENDEEIESDFVQISAGVVPNTNMFEGTKLEMINGAIVTDEYMRTNIDNVFAAGDCTAVYHKILKKKVFNPLAPGANKQGRIAGKYIAGKKTIPFTGVVGTIVWKVLGLYCGKTGITVNEAKELGYNPDSILIKANEIAHYYPNEPGVFKKKMTVLLVFDIASHRLLGAEITASSALGGKKIDVLATILQAEMTIEDIQQLDLSYAPPFAPVWDPILIAANIAIKKCK